MRRDPVRYGKRLILGEPFPIIVRQDGNRGEREFSGEWKTRKWGGMLAFYSCTASIPMIQDRLFIYFYILSLELFSNR